MAKAAAYARTEGLAHVLKSPNHWGVGVGRDAKSGSLAVVFLARASDRRAKARLPETARSGNAKFRVREMVLAPEGFGHRLGAPRPLPRNTLAASGYTGSSISTIPSAPGPNQPGGGTLSGTFRSSGGHSLRCVTNAHVALDAGIDNLLSNFPGSLLTLITPPSGRHLFTAGVQNPGQAQLPLFTVDTPWPILVPIPLLPVAGSAVLVYLDIAAGPLNMGAVTQPFFPNTNIFNVGLGSPATPSPGDAVYKLGRETFLTWGSCILTNLIVPMPVPLLPVFVIFYLNLHANALSPGDSGSMTTGNPGQELYDIDGIGLGATATSGPNSINTLSMGVPFPFASKFAGVF
ncbi:MAG TPA: hypothetical protein VMH86_17155 [Rhizomicrobium sp.]|nr:hypothetical protein [Rhizomicrobium sp.]